MDAEQLAAKRRQAYWRRRRTMDQIRERGALLATDRMDSQTLTQTLFELLIDMHISAEQGSSPRMLVLTSNALQVFHELHDRGTQLQLDLG